MTRAHALLFCICLLAVSALAEGPTTLPAAIPSAGSGQTSQPVLETQLPSVGGQSYARGDYARAAGELEVPYKAGSATIQQRLLLARARIHLKEDSAALEALKSVLTSDRENPDANALTGQLLQQAGKNAEALDYLKNAYRLKPEAVNCAALGRCYYAMGRLAQAKPVLEEALAQDIRDPSTSFLLGQICLQRGLGALAEKYLQAAREAGMDSLELHRSLGQAYMTQRKYIGPVVVRKADGVPRPGDFAGEELVLGADAGVPGKYRLCSPFCALAEGLKVLAAQPADSDGLLMAAYGWLAAGELDLSAACLAKLQTGAAGQPTLELQAELLLAQKDFAGLDKMLAGAEQAKAFSAAQVGDYYYRAAMLLRGIGDRDGALAKLNQSEKRIPASGKVLRALAELHRSAGRDKEAQTYYARLVELFPDAEDIDALRNTLKVFQDKNSATTKAGV